MGVAKLTRWGTWVFVAVAMVSPLVAGATDSFVLSNAKLVWIQGNRAYIASDDSLPLLPGSRLEFRYRHKIIAHGEVEAVYEDELVAAGVIGSFEKVKRLDQVEITALPFQPPSSIRIGYPAAGRGCLLFNCTQLTPDSTILGSAYRPESLGVTSVRFVRTSQPAIAAAWPDTLLVRFFSEATDEEIALEREDIDVGVFWPGEASSHIREVMGWKGPPYGKRNGFALTALAHRTLDSGLFPSETDALQRLSDEVFHGDLITFHSGLGIADAPEPRGRFEVAAGIPGRDVMERALRSAMGNPTTSTNWDGVVRLELVPESTWSPARVGWIGLGCPTISTQRFRKYVAMLDADALVNLLRCAADSAKP